MSRNQIRKLLLNLAASLSHFKRIFEMFKGFNTQSHASDEKRAKTKFSQLVDYLYIFFILKTLPSNYHIFLFNLKKRKEFKRYVGCSLSDPHTHNKLKVLWEKNSILVHDKYIFKIICQHFNLPVPRLYGVYKNGLINGKAVGIPQWMVEHSHQNVVLKPRSGSFGVGIFIVSRHEENGYKKLADLGEKEYIVEEHLKQNSMLDSINPYSVNSIRIITLLCPDGKVEFLAAMLRASQSKIPIDNFTLGGIVVGIDMGSGKLNKEGIVKYILPQAIQDLDFSSDKKSIDHAFEIMRERGMLRSGKVLLRHPITKTAFQDFKIPRWEELKEIAIKAQKVFYHVKSIGWDIAITEKGPVIIEGNQNWGTIGLQAANGGLLTDNNIKLLAQYGISFH